MIVGTTFGMYVPALVPEEWRVPGDPRIVQVRTRRAVDLDRLRERYMPDTLGPTVVLDKPSDFQYRAYCTPEAWGAALAAIALDMDYINEKTPVLDREHDDRLYHLYERIWWATLDAFPHGSMYDRPRGREAHRQAQAPATQTPGKRGNRRGKRGSARLYDPLGVWDQTAEIEAEMDAERDRQVRALIREVDAW